MTPILRLAGLAAVALTCSAALGETQGLVAPARIDVTARLKPDLSGTKRVGKASFYASWFAGRKMADGRPMNPHGANAASLTLPLGTTARVTNLETGLSAVVTIQDRGPYVHGRIVDLSPATAREIGLIPKLGVAKVSVTPIVLPLPDGSIRLGDAARDGVREAAND